MANTGAPWNIPYVEPTDIPRTYPDDSEDLALAIAAGLTDLDTAIDNIPVLAGIGSNVVSTTPTTFSTSSASYVNITNQEIVITPSSATSKIWVILSFSYMDTRTSTRNAIVRLTATSGPSPVDEIILNYSEPARGQYQGAGTNWVLHEPATASAVTYQAQLSAVTGTPSFEGFRMIAIEVAP